MKKSLVASVLAWVVSPSIAFSAEAAARQSAAPIQTVQIAVTEEGFVPASVTIKKGQPVKLVFTRTTDHTCAKAVVFPELKLEKQLPLNKTAEIAFTPKKSGDIK